MVVVHPHKGTTRISVVTVLKMCLAVITAENASGAAYMSQGRQAFFLSLFLSLRSLLELQARTSDVDTGFFGFTAHKHWL